MGRWEMVVVPRSSESVVAYAGSPPFSEFNTRALRGRSQRIVAETKLTNILRKDMQWVRALHSFPTCSNA